MREPREADDRQVAFDDVLRRYLPLVYGYFLGRLAGDAATAEDLTQDTFLAASKTWSPSITDQNAWLITIARRRLVDHIRRSVRLRRLGLRVRILADRADESRVLTDAEERVGLALLGLRRDHQLALLLHHADGLSISEVAAQMNRSERAVESLLARARLALRRAFMETSDE